MSASKSVYRFFKENTPYIIGLSSIAIGGFSAVAGLLDKYQDLKMYDLMPFIGNLSTVTHKSIQFVDSIDATSKMSLGSALLGIGSLIIVLKDNLKPN